MLCVNAWSTPGSAGVDCGGYMDDPSSCTSASDVQPDFRGRSARFSRTICPNCGGRSRPANPKPKINGNPVGKRSRTFGAYYGQDGHCVLDLTSQIFRCICS